MSGDSEATALVVAQKRVQALRGLGHTSIPQDKSFPEQMTAREARAYVRKFARRELHNSLCSLVYLRDFAKRETVCKDAAAQLVQYACESDEALDTEPGAIKELGVSTEDLSEFLRMKRDQAKTQR